MNRIVLWLAALTLSAPALAIDEPPTAAPELRNAYLSLSAVPGVPDGQKVDFTDPQVQLRSITVEPTQVPATGSCRVLIRINNRLAKVLSQEPPDAIAGIVEPPTNLPASTWHALLERVGIDQPPSAIVFTPSDGLLISLESTASDTKGGVCMANVLVLGSVYPGTLGAAVTPIDPDDLRSQLLSLDATPDVPGEATVSFNDDAVLVRSFDVLPTQTAEAGRCVIQARINDLLARIQINEPPTGLVGIVEPPVAIDGLTLAGINEPPSAIVFTPNDTLKVALQSLPTMKDKDKNNTCAADVLVLGTVYSNGQ